MDNIKKYGTSLGIFFLSVFSYCLILNILYYFDLISDDLLKIFIIILSSISIFISSFILGRKTKSKAYLEGIKFGVISILMMILISFLMFDSFSLGSILYYIIILSFSIFGSIIGINKKEDKKSSN